MAMSLANSHPGQCSYHLNVKCPAASFGLGVKSLISRNAFKICIILSQLFEFKKLAVLNNANGSVFFHNF